MSDKVGWRFSIQTCNGRFVPSALSSSSCAGFGERGGGRGIPSAAAARGVSNERLYKGSGEEGDRGEDDGEPKTVLNLAATGVSSQRPATSVREPVSGSVFGRESSTSLGSRGYTSFSALAVVP